MGLNSHRKTPDEVDQSKLGGFRPSASTPHRHLARRRQGAAFTPQRGDRRGPQRSSARTRVASRSLTPPDEVASSTQDPHVLAAGSPPHHGPAATQRRTSS